MTSRTVVEQDPVVAAVITTIDTLSFSVGDGEAPENPSPAFPYSVVYSLDDELRTGPMSDGQADVIHNIQVTTVGETREQAQKLVDKIRIKLLETPIPLTIASRSVQLVDLADGGIVERDETEQPRLFYAVDVWAITTTPA